MLRFDIAFGASDEHVESSRADFLTQSDVNSKEGYRALIQDRIPRQSLIRHAPWYHDLTPILSKLDSEIPKGPQALVDHLRQYNIAPEEAAPSKIESDACEQLALDLALSTDVLSSRLSAHAAKDNLDALETMSRATEAMSLTDEPPPVYLSYLWPKSGDATSSNSGTRSRISSPGSRELDCPMGVRLLLKDWEVGADPGEYVYEDPYEESYREVVPIRRSKNIKSFTQTTMPTQLQRPPLVIASKSLAAPVALPNVPAQERLSTQPQVPTNRAPMFRTGSQITANDSTVGTASQEFVTSTQIVPGPYGGRQSIKKPAKKRMGGF